MMPKVSGFDVVEAMSKMESRPPVIVVTAVQDDDPDLHRLDWRSVSAVIRKPSHMATVAALITEAATHPAVNVQPEKRGRTPMKSVKAIAVLLVAVLLSLPALAADRVPFNVSQAIKAKVADAIGKTEGGYRAAGACDQPAGFLSCSSNINGSLSTADCYIAEVSVYSDIYAMQNVSGTTVVTAKATSTTNFPILIAIHDEEGEIVAQQTQAKSATATFAAVFTRDLYVSVTFVLANATGPYNLSMSCTQQAPPMCVWSGTMACDGTYTGNVTTNECGAANWPYDAYRITLGVGQTIRIHAVSQVQAEIFVEHTDESTGTYVSGGTDQVVTYTAIKAGQHDIYVYTSDENNKLRPFGYTLSVTCPKATNCSKQRAVRH